uniref:Ig-like domain-containing protein n=1 Tax=Crocodylus porosus TaxID=8502 RepID=A0A7M4EJT7_CROPO
MAPPPCPAHPQLPPKTALPRWSTCTQSQIQLQESGPGTVKPGETLSLTCTVTGGSVTSSYWWGWIQQAPGKGLEWMRWRTGSTSYNPGKGTRWTISMSAGPDAFHLRILNELAEVIA